MFEENNLISQFSSHLFWDFDRTSISTSQLKPQVVQEVLEYGLLRDWRLLCTIYGLQQIVEVASKLPSLDPKSLAFLSNISTIPQENFKCFITKQLMPKHWDF